MLAGISDLGEGVPIHSQKPSYRLRQGTDWMRQNIILTGPFEVPEWTQQKGISTSRRALTVTHWKQMPQHRAIRHD